MTMIHTAARLTISATIALCTITSWADAHTPYPDLQLDDVGWVQLENSGRAEAQQAFHHGLAQLHNFEFDAAARDFREAQRIDPDFALAYWGEAMTHNHPLWFEQDRDAALEILARYAPTPAARQEKAQTPLERDLLAAVDVLYGSGPKEARDDAYERFMGELELRHPDEVEVAAFHALSIMGTAHEGRDFTVYMRAAAITQRWIHDHPLHPGIAHYQIHATDDPIHAPLGLAAANAYAAIAPNAAHAQHMTTHIFLALGDWDGTVSANARATELINELRADRGMGPTGCGHYPSWLMYGHLQRGEIAPAREIMLRCAGNVAAEPAFRGRGYYAWQRALFLHDSQAWDGEVADLEIGLEDEANAFEDAIVDGWVALGRGHVDGARQALDRARALQAALEESLDRNTVQQLQLAGRIALAEGDAEEAEALLREAVALENALPYGFGPPQPPKPSLELLGETLIELGRPEEALEALHAGLARTPNKRASMTAIAAAEAALAAHAPGSASGIAAGSD
jgi:tetratricopeptide (TPR) repeat protein